ncbi:MAG: hypothetical protein VZR00_06785 [Lachnospiraceae bacterium]|jgi:hypothetical protein|nr:hypothetical protein [Lachnospiraceae bacterium]MEE3461580.1 hypothetical protein [Lachnospiraceae bacterium]
MLHRFHTIIKLHSYMFWLLILVFAANIIMAIKPARALAAEYSDYEYKANAEELINKDNRFSIDENSFMLYSIRTGDHNKLTLTFTLDQEDLKYFSVCLYDKSYELAPFHSVKLKEYPAQDTMQAKISLQYKLKRNTTYNLVTATSFPQINNIHCSITFTGKKKQKSYHPFFNSNTADKNFDNKNSSAKRSINNNNNISIKKSTVTNKNTSDTVDRKRKNTAGNKENKNDKKTTGGKGNKSRKDSTDSKKNKSRKNSAPAPIISFSNSSLHMSREGSLTLHVRLDPGCKKSEKDKVLGALTSSAANISIYGNGITVPSKSLNFGKDGKGIIYVSYLEPGITNLTVSLQAYVGRDLIKVSNTCTIRTE